MTTADTRAGLDNRVTDDDGQPAVEYPFMRWLRIRRTDGPAGVILAVRIPGYLTEDQPYATQNAAKRAARQIYARYRADVRNLQED